MVAQKKRRGPTPTGKGQQIVTRLQEDLLKPLDQFVAEQKDAPSRPEGIRRILRDWLVGHGYISPD